MGLFSNNKNGGMMDVIRCDEQDYLIWKWRPLGAELGESNKENSIRWGSSLRVKEGSVAIFVYSGENGTVQDYIEGPADVVVDTKNLPIISSLVSKVYNGSSPFQAEVYFVNLANTVQMKFAVPYFDVFDSELTEFSVPVAVRGSIDFNINDYKTFIKKHRLDNFSVSDLQTQIRDAVSAHVKSIIANAPDTYEIPVIQLEKKGLEIKNDIVTLLADKLFNDYGVNLADVNIAAIDIDKDSEGYKELKSVTKELTATRLKKLNKAQNTAESREIKGNQTLGMLEKAASKLVDIKENQFVRHKKAEAEFADVIEDKRAGKIGAISGKMIRDIGNAFSGAKKTTEDSPPPIPNSVQYSVAINGEPAGPFDMDELGRMAAEKKLTADSLVWKKGMTEWQKAGTVTELKGLFFEMPPIPME